ncbi:FUSC family protein [Rhizobium sp. X9]|uniref:FUSC family protein n=1 Tax=Rhizobium sp. X9 TaxID=2815360 RepID=UPI00345E65C8
MRWGTRRLHLLFATYLHDRGSDEWRARASQQCRAIHDDIANRFPLAHPPVFDHALPIATLDPGAAILDELRLGAPGYGAAVRVGLAVVLVGLVSLSLGISRPYWGMAAAVLVLHEGATWERTLRVGVERATGTLAGLGLAGSLLALDLQGPLLIIVLMALQFAIDLLVVRNYAFATIFITAIALLVGAGGREAGDLPDLLLARGLETALGCLAGLSIFVVASFGHARRSGNRETLRVKRLISELLMAMSAGRATDNQVLRARHKLQRVLLSSPPGEIPTEAAVLGYKVLAALWRTEEDASAINEIPAYRDELERFAARPNCSKR